MLQRAVRVYYTQSGRATVLEAAANSVVCTESTDMLSSLFRLSAATVRPMTFITDQCKTVRSRCDQCLEQRHCLTTGRSALCQCPVRAKKTHTHDMIFSFDFISSDFVLSPETRRFSL